MRPSLRAIHASSVLASFFAEPERERFFTCLGQTSFFYLLDIVPWGNWILFIPCPSLKINLTRWMCSFGTLGQLWIKIKTFLGHSCVWWITIYLGFCFWQRLDLVLIARMLSLKTCLSTTRLRRLFLFRLWIPPIKRAPIQQTMGKGRKGIRLGSSKRRNQPIDRF